MVKRVAVILPVFFAGIAFGVYLHSPSPVHAQSTTIRSGIRLLRVEEGFNAVPGSGPGVIVLGFSCQPSACYVALADR